MDIAKYIGSIEGVRRYGTVCAFCRHQSYTYFQVRMCQYCELITTKPDQRVHDEAAEILKEIRSQIISGNIEDAKAKLDEIAPQTADIYKKYIIGLLYKDISDILYDSVDYTQSGFMYPNADTRKRSISILAESKKIMYTVISSQYWHIRT